MPEIQPPSTPTHRPPAPLLVTVAASILFGGLAGGIVTAGIIQTRGGNLASLTNGSRTQSVTVQESSATIDVVAKANPAVVSIVISKDYSKIYGDSSSPFSFFGFPFGQSQQQQGEQEIGGGSGFIATSDGLIVTNKHVVDDTEASYTVVMNDGKKYDATVVAKDPSNDVAVLRIKATDLPTLEFADSDAVQIGQTVIAIGNALGEYRNTVTEGIISGKARTITASDASGGSETLEGVFQTDAAINSGNSGGPLLDLTGRVIAINTAVSSSGQLIGFAIPSNVVKRDLESVQSTGTITRPFLGVRYVMVTKALADQEKLAVDHGALVQAADANNPGVVKGSPAEKAGIVAGDIILAVNSVTIDDEHSLTGLLNNYNPGDTITLQVSHDGTTKDIKVTLDTRK